jgi:CRISPR/Cas system-associated protein Cas5 (RAMP superfamily)
MVWIRADYEFGSLFSYRIPDFSSQYAISSILPGPSAIKLAIVSTAIEITGNVEYGKEIFEIIKNSEIKIQLPRRISQTNVLIKRLKLQDISKQKTKLKGDCEKCGKKNTKLWEIDGKKLCKECASKLIQTFGIRSYVHYPEKFSIYIDIPENKFKEFEKILKGIRYFGTSDSLVWCNSVNREEPPNDAIFAVENLKGENKNVLIIPVKDINPKASFDDINIYKKKKNRKDILLKKIYPIPISRQLQGKNWIVYEFV